MILSLGILRTELASLFWGSAFLALSVYSYLANLGFQIRCKRFYTRRPEAPASEFDVREIIHGETARCRMKLRLPRGRPPGLYTRYSLDLRRQGGPKLHLETPITRRHLDTTSPITPKRHGEYRTDTGHLIIRDTLGLTRSIMAVSDETQLTVGPVPRNFGPLTIRLGEGGRITHRVQRITRSDELLEIRKYFPGDDPRRLNWKLYAHIGELLLRIGEETPPPRSRVLALMDMGLPPAFDHPAFSLDYGDLLLTSFAGLVRLIAAADTEVLYSWSGLEAPGRLVPHEFRRFLSACASLWWDDGAGDPPLPPESGITVILMAAPGSPRLDRLIDICRKRGWTILAVFVEFPFPDRTHTRVSLRRVFFRDKPRDGNRPEYPRELRRGFAEAFTSAETHYGRLLGGSDYVRRL